MDTSFEGISAAAGLPMGRLMVIPNPGVHVEPDRLAELLRVEADAKGEVLAEWLCRELMDHDDTALKMRMLTVISEHLEGVA